MPWIGKANHVQTTVCLLGCSFPAQREWSEMDQVSCYLERLGLVTPQSFPHFFCGSVLFHTPHLLLSYSLKYGKPLYSEHTRIFLTVHRGL